jgi:hypothetical protein
MIPVGEANMMNTIVGGRAPLRLGLVALLVAFCAGQGLSQDPTLKPTYGSVTLKAGFLPDPHVTRLDAGGPVQTRRGGVTAWVARAPDFQLHYTAGTFPLTIYAESAADTTLLINLPDGRWVANDDGPGTGLNPLLKFERPQSGRYDIWVGTINKGITPPARLFISEVK